MFWSYFLKIFSIAKQDANTWKVAVRHRGDICLYSVVSVYKPIIAFLLIHGQLKCYSFPIEPLSFVKIQVLVPPNTAQTSLTTSIQAPEGEASHLVHAKLMGKFNEKTSAGFSSSKQYGISYL